MDDLLQQDWFGKVPRLGLAAERGPPGADCSLPSDCSVSCSGKLSKVETLKQYEKKKLDPPVRCRIFVRHF